MPMYADMLKEKPLGKAAEEKSRLAKAALAKAAEAKAPKTMVDKAKTVEETAFKALKQTAQDAKDKVVKIESTPTAAKVEKAAASKADAKPAMEKVEIAA